MGFNKIVFGAIILFLLLCSVSSIYAADLIVNDNTTYEDISDWMNSDTTVKGNNLIFDVSSYELNDTIEVTKPVNIRSNKNTQINFYENKAMFNVSTSGITFSGLTLNHHGQGTENLYAVAVLGNSHSTNINFDKMVFNLNNRYQAGIIISNWQGTISNSVLNGKNSFNIGIAVNNFNGNIRSNTMRFSGHGSFGVLIYSKWTGSIYSSSFSSARELSSMISVQNWVGSIYRSSISMMGKDNLGIFTGNWRGSVHNTKISASGIGSVGILSYKWTGGLYSSNILASKSQSTGLFVNGTWNGKISKSKINVNAKESFGVCIFSPKSKGTISKSTVSAKKGRAISVPKSIKIKDTKVFAKNKSSRIYILGPKLSVGRFQASYANFFLDLLGRGGNRFYTVKIYNRGEYISKTSSLTITTGSGYRKVVKIKPIKAGYYREITIGVPKSIFSNKLVKSARITYSNGENKKINSKTIKFR